MHSTTATTTTGASTATTSTITTTTTVTKTSASAVSTTEAENIEKKNIRGNVEGKVELNQNILCVYRFLIQVYQQYFRNSLLYQEETPGAS